MRLPAGWDGRVTREKLEASTSGLHLVLREHGGTDTPFVTGLTPIRLSPAEFVGPSPGMDPRIVSSTGRSFIDHGREFVLFVDADSLPPPAGLVARANQALATLDVQPGDFYPGTVEPATFEPAAGWDTGANAARVEIQPDGQATLSWASTISYRDGGYQFPPHETLEALPPDGIVVITTLEQYGFSNAPKAEPPFKLDDFGQDSFEGIGPQNDTRMFRAHVSQGYDVGLWVMFGRARATKEQLAAAQEELDRLRLPDWPPWTSDAER
jgi:hypothetical protein